MTERTDTYRETCDKCGGRGNLPGDTSPAGLTPARNWTRPPRGELCAVVPHDGGWWLVTSPDGDVVTINAQILVECEEEETLREIAKRWNAYHAAQASKSAEASK